VTGLEEVGDKPLGFLNKVSVTAFGGVVAITTVAGGQMALVAVSHDDPDGIVSPGETTRVTLSI